MKELLRYLAVPLVLLIVFGVFVVAYNLFGLPSFEELVALAQKFYARHLFWTVFIGALIEGLLVVNWYLPGSIVIVFGVIFARENLFDVIVTVALIILGFFITTLINYGLGRFGWYRLLLRFGLKEPLEKIKRKVEKAGLSIIFSTYIHPNLGALTATSAGILRYSFGTFVRYSIPALLGWNILWGFVVYFTGSFVLKLMSVPAVSAVLILWIVILGVRYYKSRGAREINIP